MRTASIIAVLWLAGCSGGVQHPLTYTHRDDPAWALNPEKWSPPGQNELTQPPTLPAGRMPGGT
jgi:hypothetical protein